MSDARHLPSDDLWMPTVPGALSPAAGPAKTTVPARPRSQPPLQEVLKGLDARELEGQTVFDQLFGPLPDGQAPQPKG